MSYDETVMRLINGEDPIDQPVLHGSLLQTINTKFTNAHARLVEIYIQVWRDKDHPGMYCVIWGIKWGAAGKDVDALNRHSIWKFRHPTASNLKNTEFLLPVLEVLLREAQERVMNIEKFVDDGTLDNIVIMAHRLATDFASKWVKEKYHLTLKEEM